MMNTSASNASKAATNKLSSSFRTTAAINARSPSLRSVATSSAAMPIAPTTNPHAMANASTSRAFAVIAYSPSNCRTFAVNSFVEKGFVK